MQLIWLSYFIFIQIFFMAGLTKYERWKKDNPNGTPYEALMAGVIDQEKFSELTKPVEEAKAQKYEKLMADSAEPLTKAAPKVTIIETVAAQPKLGTPTPTKNDMGFLFNKKSGRRTRMSMVAINKMVDKYPHLYARG